MPSYRSRKDPGDFFPGGRDAYLAAKVARHVKLPKICNALEEINEPLGDPYKRDGFPWITLVLGSGCLEAGLDIGSTGIRGVPAVVRDLLAGEPALPDDTNPAKIASWFAASLIEDRLGPSATTGGRSGATNQRTDEAPAAAADSAAVSITLETAKLLLCAALLTRLYHLASAARPDALSRTGHDKVEISISSANFAELVTLALNPALRLLGELIAATKRYGVTAGDTVLRQALLKIDFSLRPPGESPSLRMADLQLLTELCWYSLTHGTSVYPGWSDLLLHISTNNAPEFFDRWPLRPAFDDVDAANQFVRERYERATWESWDQLNASDNSANAGGNSYRKRFYATVADVLRQQAQLRSSHPRSSPLQPPIASAFVTSFDLELEMALWRSSTDPFIVAVPMNLLQDVAGQPPAHLASVCWLCCTIRPEHNIDKLSSGEQLARLRAPEDSDWFILGAETNYALAHGNLPVVVRMSGSPLMKAPRLVTDDGKWTDLCHRLLDYYDIDEPANEPNPKEPELRLAHVALLDEYSAMQHVASEFYIYQSGGESKQRRRHGLPAAMTGSLGERFARFWMMLGVQVGDSSIRYRFASQMIVPSDIDGATSKSPPTPRRTGLVVNSRVDGTVRDLLGWYNFDVVTDSCESFQEDLQHYLRHLQSDTHKRATRETCELP